MASDRWQWDTGVKRYRDTDTGRFLSRQAILDLRDAFIATQRERMAELAERLIAKEVTVAAWERRVRAVVKDLDGVLYAFGRGGINAMAEADWGRVGRVVRDQYGYLHGFAEAIKAGELSEAAIRARADLYVSAGVYAHERGKAAAHPGLRLPAYPGDGGTPCLANCRCSWSIAETEARWSATWTLGGSAAGPCDGCTDRAGRYAPYTQDKE